MRNIFGGNLRALCAGYPSIAGLCRELGLNRTQFNRYLAGESFPRPDVLHLICKFFDVDARILLEPIGDLRPVTPGLLNHAKLNGFFACESVESVAVPAEQFPSGFYRFFRRSFRASDRIVVGLVYVMREDGYTFLRGYKPRAAIASGKREFRGLVMRQHDGITVMTTHRNAMSFSFTFLAQETPLQPNLWEGYVARPVRERVTGCRTSRTIYEYLGDDRATIMKTARMAGAIESQDVPPFYSHLLRPGRAFR